MKGEFTCLWELHFRMPGTYSKSMAKKMQQRRYESVD